MFVTDAIFIVSAVKYTRNA